MSPLNVTTLCHQYSFDYIRELNKASEILKEIYYEKEHNFIGFTYSTIGSYLEKPDNRWISEIWNEKNLYFYNILDEAKNELFNGTYTQIIKAFKSGKSDRDRPYGKLMLTAFKAKEPEPKDAHVLTFGLKTTDSEKIKKLETDISEIKELLKKR